MIADNLSKAGWSWGYVALIPFFAFRELSRVMGKGVLATLLLKGHASHRVSRIDERVRHYPPR
jgi:hypothetical protein